MAYSEAEKASCRTQQVKKSHCQSEDNMIQLIVGRITVVKRYTSPWTVANEPVRI